MPFDLELDLVDKNEVSMRGRVYFAVSCICTVNILTVHYWVTAGVVGGEGGGNCTSTGVIYAIINNVGVANIDVYMRVCDRLDHRRGGSIAGHVDRYISQL